MAPAAWSRTVRPRLRWVAQYLHRLAINAGKVAVGSGGSLVAGGAVSLTGVGADLDISLGGNQTIGALSGIAGSTVTLGQHAHLR